jgi:adenine-specific DNA-methyltransferase
MSDNFTGTFFSSYNCRKIGFIREDVELRFNKGEVNHRERALIITSLLYAADKIANTCGHYDAYRRDFCSDKPLELALPLVCGQLNKDNICFNEDINTLVPKLTDLDLVYLDPPYNSRQYCDCYHLLENIAKWDKPKVTGVAKKMDRSSLKSRYCTQRAKAAFENLITNIEAKYILLSYNNMALKGDNRSNAKIEDKDIFSILEQKGTVEVFKKAYKPFTTGKSDIFSHEERLFLCSCR